MRELTEDPLRKEALGEQTIFVQGSMDLLLETESGQLILIDYKTDRVSEREQNDLDLLASNLKARHGVQLSYYAKAVKALFGKEPDQICIYSVPIGKTLDISI
jgi:ATP-dependent helicase/nuclease subunit A